MISLGAIDPRALRRPFHTTHRLYGVGAVEMPHPESPSFETAVTAIMEAYPYRKLTKDYGSARAGQTIGVDRPLAEAIVRAANAIGAHPYDLANVMHYESGFTFRPDIQSGRKVGDTFDAGRATGIIQFMPSTAKLLGTTTQALHDMTAVQQVAYVQKYLDLVRQGKKSDSFGDNPIPGPDNGKLDSLQKVAMAVFFPRAMDWGPHHLFPGAVLTANPGISTPAAYVRNVAKRAKLASTSIPRETTVETLAKAMPSPQTAAAGLAVGIIALAILAAVASSGNRRAA